MEVEKEKEAKDKEKEEEQQPRLEGASEHKSSGASEHKSLTDTKQSEEKQMEVEEKQEAKEVEKEEEEMQSADWGVMMSAGVMMGQRRRSGWHRKCCGWCRKCSRHLQTRRMRRNPSLLNSVCQMTLLHASSNATWSSQMFLR